MKDNLKYYISMVFATILFAGAFIAGKLGVGEFSPVVMTYLRISLAAIIIFPIMLHKEKENWKINKEEGILAFKLGLIGMTFYHLLFFSALRYTTASNASVINASMPVLTAIIAFFILKEKLSFRRTFFIFTAFLGVVLTITKWDLTSIYTNGFNKGDLLMICATTSWATYGVIAKKGMKSIKPLKLTAYSFVMCVIILTPFALKEIIFENALDVPPKAYLAIVYMALFPTVIGYTVQQTCIKHIGPSNTALFINLVPIFSIFMATIFLGESLYPLTIVSAFIIILSVISFTRIK